ncbi:capsule biosynthesis protein [Rhodobacteraceae bacterium R_SAG9]|nr:capsule biosynthesis protein [Rhodobacteraceae bacterium R_SAG9]
MSANQKSAPNVSPARPKSRHWMVLLSFVALVALPIGVVAWYLWERALDRYVSYVGFSVRTEETGSAIEMLGGIVELSGSSSSDTDILYKFIQSQELVLAIDRQLDLRKIWAKADPEIDPVFAYHPPGTIEDLVTYWRRMVSVFNDSSSGLIDLNVQAFDPEDAQLIATAIYNESSAMINRLSAISRDDATRYARDELDLAVVRLKDARATITQFRNEKQIVDPEASMSSQIGLLSSLELQLAQTLIDLNVLLQTSRANDPRIIAANREAAVIRDLIAEEREKIGLGDGSTNSSSNAFADIVGEYERLAVDLEFAQQAYISALAAFDASKAEALRQSRYLAAHVRPTLAEAPEHPQKLTLLGLTSLFLFLAWGILVLAAYALKDRR